MAATDTDKNKHGNYHKTEQQSHDVAATDQIKTNMETTTRQNNRL